MDHIQSHIPQLVQVYQPPSDSKMHNPQIIHIAHPGMQAQGKVTYQQTITSDIHIPMSTLQNEMISQNQIVMSCQQTHLQSIQPLHGQVLQGTDLTQQLQITSHMLLPPVPVFKQQILLNEVQQYYGYDYGKECVVSKVEAQDPLQLDKPNECKIECEPQPTESELDTDRTERRDKETNMKMKRSRNLTPKPSTWASNIRKQKHQRGEAYISCRGKFVPERQIKSTKDCLQKCKFKCREQISDEDRELIFKSFYLLSCNEKKHFILNSTERNSVKQGRIGAKRKHSFKYSFVVRSQKYTVCKNFYLGTLAISQKPVYNVHNGKSDTNIPKPDGRGLSQNSAHALPNEVKDRVRKHIQSFTTIDSKPVKQFSKKKQFLLANLSIKRMYTMYFDQCSKENIKPVKESMYRKIFTREYNLHFVKIKEEPLCCKCKGSIKKK